MGKISFLPTLEDAYGSLSVDQLEILRQQVLSEGGELASIQSRFNYAWGLIKSTEQDDQRLGVKLLTDIYKESSMRRRECLYYLTIGCYKLGEFSTAKRYSDALCSHEPDNKQARTLQSMVENKIQRESFKGIAIASGCVAVAATVAGMLFRKRR
ncbi:LAQU0S09e01288g1_1 [Lachancea quebecensis]|uniref:Mitochondrial fission 1 protein n=1 Tax=Lachancea quebecensis TaxID=1654605 RepID=A0A0P1KSU8_9SACH|nr:LAQU0S09e01288g1_1 [Lachancea quebecensis]